MYIHIFFRNGEGDAGRPRVIVNGIVGQPPTDKYADDLTDSLWGPRENIESQTRQHYLARNRYIAEQNGRLPYPSVYGTQSLSEFVDDANTPPSCDRGCHVMAAVSKNRGNFLHDDRLIIIRGIF